MTIPFYDEVLNGEKTFNMVNLNDDNLKKIGIQPLYIKLKPLYFDRDGKLYYSTSDNHYETNINNYIKDALLDAFGLNNSLVDKIIYIIDNNKIYFFDKDSYDLYKFFPRIKEDIQKEIKKEICLEIEPTDNDFKTNYYQNYIDFSDKNINFISITLSNKEMIEYYYKKRLENLKEFKNPNELSGKDVLFNLNYNSNLFIDRTIDWNFKGVYNAQTMNLINSYIRIKRYIYRVLYDLSINSKDIHSLFMNLIDTLKIYKYPEILQKNNKVMYYRSIFNFLCSDLLVLFFKFSKIETMRKNTITTNAINPHELFFNYEIRGFNIVRLPQMHYNNKNNSFEIDPLRDYDFSLERELENDINLIKKYVPFDERYKYSI